MEQMAGTVRTRCGMLFGASALALASTLLLIAAGPAEASRQARPAGTNPMVSRSGSPMFSARLLYAVRARDIPSPWGRSVRYLHEVTSITGKPMTIPIYERREVEGTQWLRVMLPGRPNNRSGWIPAAAAKVSPLSWRIVVNVSRRAMAVYRSGKRIARFRVVVGKRETSTPRGRFFVVERVILGTRWAPRGRALALSAYSEILRHYDGGQGQVAIHARGTLSGDLGTASSHGCVRVDDRVALWLARRVPLGTFVKITG